MGSVPDDSRPAYPQGGVFRPVGLACAHVLCGVAALLCADSALANSVITVGFTPSAEIRISNGIPNASIQVLRPNTANGLAPMRPVQAGISLEGASGHITVSKASDIVGQLVDIYRPVYTRRATPPTGLPLTSASLTSGFGMRRHPILGGYRAHKGVDLAAPMGTPIFAPSDGVVSRANWNGGYGLFVELNHGGSTQTLYGHLSRLKVAPGQKVRKGEVIGYVGSTGRSTGAHLHYEMRVNGQPINPLAKKP